MLTISTLYFKGKIDYYKNIDRQVTAEYKAECIELLKNDFPKVIMKLRRLGFNFFLPCKISNSGTKTLLSIIHNVFYLNFMCTKVILIHSILNYELKFSLY